jgi:hypothetical protein
MAARRVPWSFWTGAAWLVARRPRLWTTALRQGLRLARPGWWRRPPFVPLPDADYLAFRLDTQYGTGPAAGTPDPRDLVEYLKWCHEVGVGASR